MKKSFKICLKKILYGANFPAANFPTAKRFAAIFCKTVEITSTISLTKTIRKEEKNKKCIKVD